MIKYRLYGKKTLALGIKKYFDSICKSVSKQLKINEDLVFDVNIISSIEIKNINKKYRKINKVTDVISFANRDNDMINVSLLGEIFICFEQAKKQALLYGHSLKRELTFLFTHGLLHLLGFDHQTKKDETKMIDLTKKVIEIVGIY